MPYRVDARMSGRHPFEIFTMTLAFATGLPTLLGIQERPSSVMTYLPHIVALLWAIVLTVGSAGALVGVWWKERATGLILEQLGLGLVGLGSVVYAGVAIGRGIFLIPVGIVAGFGLSCLWRYFQLQSIVDSVQAEELRRKGPS